MNSGIDVGTRAIKLAVMEGKNLLGFQVFPSGSDINQRTEASLDEFLKELGLAREKIGAFTATGVGRKHVSYAAQFVPEIVSDARGAVALMPSARTVVDIGAEEARVVRCDARGKVLDFARNEKCAAGAGVFVETMARALETDLEELGPRSLESTRDIHINASCAVFAESEVVSLIHANVERADIIRAINEAIAVRTASVIRRVGLEKDIVLVGGVARNRGILRELEKCLECKILVPDHPQITGAIGAAIMAQERR